MALATMTKIPLLPRTMWFLAGAALAVSSILVYGEVATGSDDSSVVPAPAASPTEIEDDPLFTRYGDASTTEASIEDDPLVMRYGDR